MAGVSESVRTSTDHCFSSMHVQSSNLVLDAFFRDHAYIDEILSDDLQEEKRHKHSQRAASYGK